MPKQDTDGLDFDAERAIVARLLEDTSKLVARDRLYATAPSITPERLDAAVASLARARVLLIQRDGLRATGTLKRLAALRMVVF